MNVSGLKELDEALGELGKRMGRAVLQRSLRKAAEPMRKMAEEGAPYRTGRLGGSIKILARAKGADLGRAEYRETLSATGSRSAAQGALRDARRAAVGQVNLFMGPTDKDGWHGRFIEFGTRHHDPDPFMRPAFDAEAQPTINRLAPILRVEIDKAAARAARRALRGTAARV